MGGILRTRELAVEVPIGAFQGGVDGWVDEWGLLDTGGNSTDNRTQVGGFSNHLLKFLPSPKQPKRTAPQPHTQDLGLRSCWVEGGREVQSKSLGPPGLRDC